MLGNVEIALKKNDYAAKDITILGSNSTDGFDWSNASKWYKLAEINDIQNETTAHTYNIPKTNIGTTIDGPEDSGTSKITPFHHINTAYKYFRFVVTETRGNYANIAQLLVHFTTEPLFIKSRSSSTYSSDNFRDNLRDFNNETIWETGNKSDYKTGDDDEATDRSQSISSSGTTYFYDNDTGQPNSGTATRTYYRTINNYSSAEAEGEWVQYEYDKQFTINSVNIIVSGNGYSARNITILGSNTGYGYKGDIWYKIAEINNIPQQQTLYTYDIPKTNIGTSTSGPSGTSSTVIPFPPVFLPFKYFRFVVTVSRGYYANIAQLRINHAQSHTIKSVAKIANAEYLNVNNFTGTSIKFYSDSRIKNDITIVDDTKAIDLVNKLESKEIRIY